MAALSGAARSALVACLFAGLVGLLGLPVASARAAATSVQSIALWKSNAAPVAWSASPDRVFYNAVGADGMYEGYSAAPDGSAVTCVTCAAPSFARGGAATQRGVSDVSSDGRYALLEVENPNHLGPAGAAMSEPGKGAYDDVWLATADGSQMWPLTNVTAAGSGVIGTMWARFSPSGNQVVFAEMYAPATDNLGYWKLVVATIVWNGGVPSLADQTVIEPTTGLFMEPYGFSPDGTRVLFASDLDQPSWMDSQIWEANTDGSGLTRLSPDDAPAGLFTDYNEFAFYLPSGDGIIYGRTVDSQTAGIDYWLMGPAGGPSQRLTYFNEPWSSESQGYIAVGSLAFNPADPNQFLAAVTRTPTSAVEDGVLVTLNDPSAAGGLTAQYFSDGSSLARAPTYTEVDNPSSGFKWPGSPAPGVSAADYAVRWTGTITPPATGTYAFCLTSDSGAQLSVAGQVAIAGMSDFGLRSCAPVSATAGQPIPVELDYSHSTGDGDIQLTWIPPGAAGALSATDGTNPLDWSGTAAAGEIIPSADMTPGNPPAAQAPSAPGATSGASGGAAATKHAVRKVTKPTKRAKPKRRRKAVASAARARARARARKRARSAKPARSGNPTRSRNPGRARAPKR